MKTYLPRKSSAGIALIEALIAAAVVGIGLLATSSLQGTLISDSKDNKTRSEAKALAEAKMEEVRETVTNTSFTALASSSDQVTGLTQNFSRTWSISNQTSPVRKTISINVCWPAGACTDQVVMQSVLSFSNPGTSTMLSEGTDTTNTMIGGPSTNAKSSDVITKNVTLTAAQRTGKVAGDLVTIDGKKYIVQNNGTIGSLVFSCTDSNIDLGDGASGISAYTNGPNEVVSGSTIYKIYWRRVDHDNVAGSEAIEFFENYHANDGNYYCIPRIRYNGGVVIPISGTVYSAAHTGQGAHATLASIGLFTLNTTEDGTYCYFNPATGATSAAYTCYVGGNCTGYTGTAQSPDRPTQCIFDSGTALAAATVGPGGWRGKVGLLGVASQGFNVCFSEELAANYGANGTSYTIDTARNYYTRNRTNNNNEGINKPFNSQTFLIVDGKSNASQLRSECVTQAANLGITASLITKKIQRDICGPNNVYDPVAAVTPNNSFSCP